jgi:hypothetical protein
MNFQEKVNAIVTASSLNPDEGESNDSHFDFSDQMAGEKEVMLFKNNDEYSIELYYNLLEKTEELNRYEKVTVFYNNKTDGINKTIFITTAVSPISDDKYDHLLWNLAIENRPFGAFYLKEESPIHAFNLMGNELGLPVKIFIIGMDDTIRYVTDSGSEVFLASASKGILFMKVNTYLRP